MKHRKKERASVLNQTKTYFKKNVRIFMNQRDWKFIIIAAFISLLVCAVVGKDMFSTFESTKSGFFAIISAGIWIGVFNSIQSICKEHDTITNDYRAGLHMRAYIFAHVLFQCVVCFAQSVLLLAICIWFIDFPEGGIIFSNALVEYFITLFLVVWGSDIMGIMISSIVGTPNEAMTTMPFVLILQLVMSGVLFELSGWSEMISYITYSKWGMSALGSIGNLNDPELPLKMSLVFPQVVRLEEDKAYVSTVENLLRSWEMMGIIAIVCIVIAIIGLKVRNKNS